MDTAKKIEEAGPVPMRLKTEAKPNIVTAGQLLASTDEMRDLSLLKPVSAISVQVFLAYDDLQKIMDAIVKAFNASEDKAAVMATEVELPFQPFPIEKFTGEGLSAAGFTKLKGWLVTRGESHVKLPNFGGEAVH